MSLADEFLRDAGGAQAGSLADQFAADAAAPATGKPPPAKAQRPTPEPLSWWDQQLAKVPTGLVNNPAVAGARNITTMAAAPLMGGAQLIANAMPEKATTLSDLVTGKQESVGQLYNRKIAEVLRKNADAAKENPASGVDEFVGGMISPMNLAFGGAKPAITAGQRAIQGAKIGAVGGATSPVEVGESEKFWGQKGAQTAIGAAGGAVLAPVIGLAGDKVLARINAKGFDPKMAAKEADDIISGSLKESGQRLEDIPPDALTNLRKQVVDALSQGKKLDAAAALRAKDFAAEKMTPTQGWITRDPMQFAAEQNVKGVKGAGEKLTDVIAQGNQTVTTGIGQYGTNASEAPAASRTLADALKSYGKGKSAEVSAEYAAARASAGKDLDVPLQGLAQDYATVIDRFGSKVPTEVKAKFAALGLDSSKPSNQKQVFTFEAADDLRKLVNEHVGSDPVTNKALGKIREGIDRAQNAVDASGGPFAKAVGLARENFGQQREIPALKAAMDGKVDDTFVAKYVIGSKSSEQVQKLAGLLRKEAPDAFEETRQQIGAHLSRAAFGENTSGSKAVNQEGYNKALRQIGTAKLEAFFEPQEVEQLKRLGRLSSYMVSPPAGSASNYSNTASALANLLRSAGGFLPVGKGTVQFMGDKLEAGAAMKANVPVTPNLTDEQRKALSRALIGITGGASIALPSRVIGE